MRKFRRPGHRVGLAGTIIGVGIAALMTLASSGSGAAPSDVIRLKGHNGKSLPLVRVAGPATMIWTNSGPYFQITSYGGYCSDGAVTSQAHRGTTYVPPGRYGQLRVNAIGDWTITIRPGAARIGAPIRFNGSGGQALPPFRLRSSKTMHWTNTGSIFQTFPMGPTTHGIVSSEAHGGSMRLPAGRYRLYVSAVAPDEPTGSWTISIR